MTHYLLGISVEKIKKKVKQNRKRCKVRGCGEADAELQFRMYFKISNS